MFEYLQTHRKLIAGSAHGENRTSDKGGDTISNTYSLANLKVGVCPPVLTI